MKPGPNIAIPSKPVEFTIDECGKERWDVMGEWWSRVCAAPLSRRAMRLAGFVLLKHWSSSGGALAWAGEIREGL